MIYHVLHNMSASFVVMLTTNIFIHIYETLYYTHTIVTGQVTGFYPHENIWRHMVSQSNTREGTIEPCFFQVRGVFNVPGDGSPSTRHLHLLHDVNCSILCPFNAECLNKKHLVAALM